MGKLIHGHCTVRDDGNKGTHEYIAYFAMKNRCLNKKQARYKDYGERGIVICDRWLNGEDGLSGFECFLADLGGKPTKNHTLEREDNDLGYSPGNCRWATMKEQSRNTRQTRLYDVGFGPMSMVECIERYGRAQEDTVRMRLHRGWHPDDAIFTPVGERPVDQPPPF
jgi:hypothetical protein